MQKEFEERSNQLECTFEKLLKNREKVPLEVLKTRYAKAYGQLVSELEGHARWYIDWLIKTGFPKCESSTEWNKRLDSTIARIREEEQQPGKSYERACKALIDDLDFPAFFREGSIPYQRIEAEFYQRYWDHHCIWTGPQNNRWVYNAITKKFWLPSWPENHYPDGCWIKADYSEPDPHRPPPQINDTKEEDANVTG